MRYSISAAIVAATLFLPCVGVADEIVLSGVLRDFLRGDRTGGHPDFENATGSVTTGMLDGTLPGDKVPVYVGTSGLGGVQSAESFRQWYTDVAGVNQRLSHSVTLSNVGTSSPDVYRFESNAFFPLDGQLWGNEDLTHNYHFTFAVNGQFVHRAGARFRFRGDDDLWLFIDNRLAVDLGGVHPAAEATLDLDTLGLTPGNSYAFDLYFAERHTTESNFLVEMNFAVVPEPTALCMALACGALLTGRRRA